MNTIEYRYGLKIDELSLLHNYFSKFKQIKEIRTSVLVNIGDWTNKEIERADEEGSLKNRPLKYMELACHIVGYNSHENNKRFVKVFQKKVFNTMTLDENVKMLLVGSRLNLRAPSLEKLEIYVVDQFAA